ncbi:response regulator FixJ [Parvibaculum sp.]|jgi:two-component system response regulator FixJ|uniref:response regulator FixJ n=1 Tax=Parvibaculum sp. TaxID=2024848 RepID=UPI000C3CDFE3|nr:response regulator FixJ [Parvibaculum sp.]MAU60278.1 DNA-binding response regulator [Parvibaculum sp.]MBO6669490.1 response regulator [Parvibaculum sp.]MBO6692210.1 response regulator [Parvibaculum sp.]MBO6715876.1 response regulator [Parvibaculum sp.]|tara:strand:+ start:1529 stop:2158 length:630 start_codon:yes stop_codon:yes gene_type:complete
MKSSDKIHVVDDDEAVRSSLRMLLESAGFDVAAYASAADFLESYRSGLSGCVVADVRMPGMDGIQLQEELAQRHAHLPFIAMTGHGDVPLAVRAMKAGAVDFIEKPFEADDLISAVERALALGRNRAEDSGSAEAAALVAGLTSRERQVLEHLVAGHSNKVIAHELDISPRTVEVHRAHLMEKLKVRSLPEAVRLALAAEVAPAEKKKG